MKQRRDRRKNVPKQDRFARKQWKKKRRQVEELAMSGGLRETARNCQT